MNFSLQRLGTGWPHIADARQRTAALRAKLEALAPLTTEDAATIMYGSIGREEVTESSDVDWTMLIDGPSDPSHLQLVDAREVAGDAASAIRSARKPGGRLGRGLGFRAAISKWLKD